jgi:hypothetical protein
MLTSKQGLAVAIVLPFLWCSLALAQGRDRPEGRQEASEHGQDGGEWHQKRCVERYARKLGRLAYLEARLTLTEQQRSVWNKWRQIKVDAAEQRRSHCLQHQPKEGPNPTVLEREAQLEKRLAARLQQLQASRPALQALYEALSSEQKIVFDQRAGWHRHHWHHGRHGASRE